MSFNAQTLSFGSSYSNGKVQVLESISKLPVPLATSVSSGVVYPNGLAALDASGAVTLYLDTALSYDYKPLTSPTLVTSGNYFKDSSGVPYGGQGLLVTQEGVLKQLPTLVIRETDLLTNFPTDLDTPGFSMPLTYIPPNSTTNLFCNLGKYWDQYQTVLISAVVDSGAASLKVLGMYSVDDSAGRKLTNPGSVTTTGFTSVNLTITGMSGLFRPSGRLMYFSVQNTSTTASCVMHLSVTAYIT
jgi:hypothetical protein